LQLIIQFRNLEIQVVKNLFSDIFSYISEEYQGQLDRIQ
jgi:hypothetical protein